MRTATASLTDATCEPPALWMIIVSTPLFETTGSGGFERGKDLFIRLQSLFSGFTNAGDVIT